MNNLDITTRPTESATKPKLNFYDRVTFKNATDLFLAYFKF